MPARRRTTGRSRRRGSASFGAVLAVLIGLFVANLSRSSSGSTARAKSNATAPRATSASDRTRTARRSSIPALPATTAVRSAVEPSASSPPRARVAAQGALPASTHRDIAFASRAKLRQHFDKHGAEFGSIGIDEYLALAQDLRDAPRTGALANRVLEAVQRGGTLSRFDRVTGTFIAFDRDLTLRTCFRPDDGEAYFRRAATRTH